MTFQKVLVIVFAVLTVYFALSLLGAIVHFAILRSIFDLAFLILAGYQTTVQSRNTGFPRFAQKYL